MGLKLDAESYLQSGSNELRVLEFRTAGMTFGINILKVSKIISDLVDFTRIPETHPAIGGVFKDMNRLVPVIDLAVFLGVADEDTKREKVIVTEFFGILTGLWVGGIDWIHHFGWQDITDAGDVFGNIDHRYVIGIVKPTEERMVLLLDYESMLLDLRPDLEQAGLAAASAEVDFSEKRILVAEDSPAVRAMLVSELAEHGCEVREAGDGTKAWEMYQKEVFDLVICDVEMPQMDGLAVTLRIRQSERPDTPVIVYSSIGDPGMKARAAFLKADAHITKLNVGKLLETAYKLMRGEKLTAAAPDATPAPTDEPASQVIPIE